MKAVGYTRLSDTSDLSIDRQKRQIRGYCEDHGMELAHIYNDGERASGFDPERPQYQELRDTINDGGCDAVVVAKTDRIGRDFNERMRFLLDLSDCAVELHSPRTGQVDLDDAISLAVEGVHAASDDQVKRTEIESSKEAVKERMEQGYDHGRPPTGFTYNDDGTRWVPDDQFETVVDAIELIEDGVSYREVADRVDIPRSTLSEVVNRKDLYLNWDGVEVG